MTDLILPLVQMALTGCLAAWMIVGVADNWMHPKLNEDTVAMVTRFDRMARDYPEDYAQLAYRRIADPRWIRRLFYALVTWETVAALGLTAGTLMLGAALLGLTDLATARAAATLGALAFTLNWAGFLVGGNYFAYWYCHFQAQVTHFLLALWGTAVIILLQLGS